MHIPPIGRAVAVRVAPVAVVTVAAVSVIDDAIRAQSILRGRTLLSFGGADGRIPLTGAPQFLQADLRPGAHGTLADASIGLRIACALPTLIEIAVVVIAAALVFGIVRRISTAAVFTPPVLRRWRLLAGVLVVGGVLQGLADTVANQVIWRTITSDIGERAQQAFLGGDYQGIGLAIPAWPVPTILVGVIAASLAVAFRAGAELERQTVGVI